MPSYSPQDRFGISKVGKSGFLESRIPGDCGIEVLGLDFSPASTGQRALFLHLFLYLLTIPLLTTTYIV